MRLRRERKMTFSVPQRNGILPQRRHKFQIIKEKKKCACSMTLHKCELEYDYYKEQKKMLEV